MYYKFFQIIIVSKPIIGAKLEFFNQKNVTHDFFEKYIENTTLFSDNLSTKNTGTLSCTTGDIFSFGKLLNKIYLNIFGSRTKSKRTKYEVKILDLRN